MNKIRIFVDAHIFDSSYQGTSTYIKGIYSEIVKDSDFEITLAACNIEKLKKEFNNPFFKFIRLPSSSKIKRLAIDIPKILKSGLFDYAHFQYITPINKSCKYINTIHDLLFLQFPFYFPLKYRISNHLTFRLSAMRSDIICTVSEFSKLALKNYFKIENSKILLTPNAVDVYDGDLIDVKEKYNLDKYILYVSRFEPRKNHITLLRAFAELELYKQGYKLIFIGRYKDVQNINYVNYYGQLEKAVQSSVLYFENIDNNELTSFYKFSDLFVYPSLAEGFGIPPLEAAVANCKVLCSNQTAMADFYFFGEYLFDPNNIDELKEKMVKVLKEEAYPFKSIREAVLRNYSWNIIAQNFASALKRLSKK